MTFFRNLPISRKLAVAFGAVIFICVGIGGGVALIGLILLNNSTVELNSRWVPSMARLANMRHQYETIHRIELDYMLCPDDACRTSNEQARTETRQKMSEAISSVDSLLTTPDEHDLLSAFRDNYEAALLVGDRALASAREARSAEASDILRTQKAPLFQKAEQNLDELTALEIHNEEQAASRAAYVYNGIRVAATLAGILGAILSILAIRWLSRQIAGPLVSAAELLKRVAAKDLTATLEADSEDEIGQMARALNTTVESMREMLQEIQRSSEQMAAATEQIASAASEASHSAHEQSTQVQHVAISAQQMSSSIAEISKNCEQAALASQESTSSAIDGGTTMQEAVEGMQKIAVANTAVVEKMELLDKRSTEIGKVVEVIREIAEQTNLLALNAAIESARAGEHGRGFAVVASEVRRLAERTQQATAEIDQMVGNIQADIGLAMTATETGRSEVNLGLDRTSSAEATLNTIIDVTRRSDEMVSVIATAATEQASVSTEISESINLISRMVEKTSASADESAEACQSLRRLATNLESIVQQFRINGQNGRRQNVTELKIAEPLFMPSRQQL